MPWRSRVHAGALTLLATLTLTGAAYAAHFDPPSSRRATAAVARDLSTVAARATARLVRSLGLDRLAAAQARGLAPLAPAGLPIKWCGQPAAAGPLMPQGTRQFQLVYAHPADQPDHFWRFANLLQADASYIDRFISVESNRTEYMRFAMGTSCGPQYVSLIDWQMPQARAAYAGDGSSGEPNFSAIDDDAVTTFGRPLGVDTVIYVDGLVDFPGQSRDSYGGMAEAMYTSDTSPGPSNANNAGGQFSYLFGVVGGRPASGDEALDPPTLLHEASHAIGAVSPLAPESTGAQHCFVVQDIMCYADGGPHGQQQDLVTACGFRNDVMQYPYDCGGDNYFNPAPAPGSYLASHWNLYNSMFMAPCSENEQACGTGQAPLNASKRWRSVKLTLTATTLPDRSVRVSAKVRGLGRGTSATVCLHSTSVYGAPPCGTVRGARPVTLTTLEPADGEGFRPVAATARVGSAGAGGHAAGALAVSLTLP